MRVGIRVKIIASFVAVSLIPPIIVLFVGNTAQSEIVNIITLIISLLLPFCIFASLLSGLLARSVLTPLKELHNATRHIIEGNYEFKIKYKSNDEMGEFCAALELMKERLKASLEKQASLECSRKELIASISHDLRTPLSSIKGYVEGLQDGIVHDREKYNRYISVIKNKTESLDRLIESLFQYSQLDIGAIDIALCKRDSAELLDAVISPFENEFADLSIHLAVIRPFPMVQIRVNENSIAQVFDNLISNAKRYVFNNGVIKIEVVQEKSYLKITVSDNGIGITKEDIPHVFKQFYRCEKSRSRSYGGAGLGLSICKMIIEHHSGDIWVESVQGTETRFSFTLPIV